MRTIDEVLIAGVGMNGGHESLFDAKGIVENLDHGNKAIGRTRSVRDNLVLGRVKGVVIHANNEGRIGVSGRSRNDDVGSASFKMGGGLIAISEEARGLDNDVDAEFLPGKILGIANGGDLQKFAVDKDSVLGCFNSCVEATHDRVVLKQVRHSGHRTQIVGGNDLDISAGLPHRPEEIAADATEAIDADTDGHCGHCLLDVPSVVDGDVLR
jgi:hypothetical protein